MIACFKTLDQLSRMENTLNNLRYKKDKNTYSKISKIIDDVGTIIISYDLQGNYTIFHDITFIPEGIFTSADEDFYQVQWNKAHSQLLGVITSLKNNIETRKDILASKSWFSLILSVFYPWRKILTFLLVLLVLFETLSGYGVLEFLLSLLKDKLPSLQTVLKLLR